MMEGEISSQTTALFLGYGVSEFLAEYLAKHNFSNYYADHEQRVKDANFILSYADLITKRIELAESQKYHYESDLYAKIIREIGYELANILHDADHVDRQSVIDLIDGKLSSYYAKKEGSPLAEQKTKDYVWMLFKEYC